MGTLLIRNIGGIVTGDITAPMHPADRIFVSDGIIRSMGGGPDEADVVIDARGLLALPGLIDGHTHPSFGTYAPAQGTVDWIRSYLHGGVTSMVSAGELHVPGLPLDAPDAQLFKRLAILARHTYARLRPSGARVHAGTLLVASGLSETDFDELAAEGVRFIKFIFYDYAAAPAGEIQHYVAWARQRRMIVKIHAGGVSRSGVSRPADAEIVKMVGPDVVGHINGGPISMRLEDVRQIVHETDFYLELTSSGNTRTALQLVEWVAARGELHRIVLGTDTPGGTGIIPRGMLRNIAMIAAHTGVRPEEAICMATGNTARAHALVEGVLREGAPADIILVGCIEGTEGRDPLEAFHLGDIPGISVVITDGVVRAGPRTEQLPPPRQLAIIAGLT